ncbi:uncharacterized protein LOC115784945 [Archocentrus centrarchus]|uniref:uncharacterized protein LOC115784945 n=1 Tax=Archocentrus centrarchus TaxID=63155 RepID=UPI0011EA030B|nr:uncharacterized protein LOC115784945 [Archocentrus centrarchus]
MSALWLEFILILCFYGTAWTDADVEGVVRKHVGQSVTIQCRSTSNQETLNLKKGLHEERDIFYATVHSDKRTIDSKFTDRLQYHEKFPNVEILIKNLTLNDTGPYWCVYKTIENYGQKITKGSGSVLLVVTEKPSTVVVRECQPPQNDMVLWAVVIAAAVLILILSIPLIMMILKTKPSHNTVKRRQQVPVNDVYEDMRGTIRR